MLSTLLTRAKMWIEMDTCRKVNWDVNQNWLTSGLFFFFQNVRQAALNTVNCIHTQILKHVLVGSRNIQLNV